MNYSDSAFVQAVETCNVESFPHADHVRLAWIYSERFGLEEGSRRMVETILRLAAKAGAPGKYHHTMTLAWMRIVDAARRSDAAQLPAHADSFDRNVLYLYYSPEVLDGGQARHSWVEPDRAPLP